MGKLSSIPFLRPTLALVAGVFVGLFFWDTWLLSNWVLLFCSMYGLIVVSLIAARWRQLQLVAGSLVLLSFMLLGILLSVFSQSTHNESFFAPTASSVRYKALKIQLTSDIQKKQNTWRASAKVVEGQDSAGIRSNVSGNVLVYWPFKKNSSLPIVFMGDVLWIPNRTMDMPHAAFPEDFDFKAVMRYRDVQHQIFLANNDWVKVGNELNTIVKWSNDARTFIINIIANSFTEREAGVLQSLLVGFKDNVDTEDLNAFAVSGTMHVLAVSGMHVGLIYVFLVLLFTGKLKNANLKIWQGIFVIIALWAYAFVTGLSASVLRAAIMFSIIEAGRSVFRQPHHVLNSFFAAAFIQLCVFPLNLVDAGFQLSYLAVLGIIFLYPIVYEWYKPKYKVVDYVYQLGLVSVCATIATLPVTLYFFGTFPVWFIVANILIVPLSSVIIFSAIGFLIFFKIPFLGFVFHWITATLSKCMLFLAMEISTLPNASIRHISFTIVDVFFLLMILAMITVYLNTKLKVLLWQSAILCVAWAIATSYFSFQRYHSKEIVCAELRGQAICSIKSGRKLFVFASDASKLKSDSLLQFMTPYIKKNKILLVEWNRPNVHTECHEIVKRDKNVLAIQVDKFGVKSRLWFCFNHKSVLDNFKSNDVIVLQYKNLRHFDLVGKNAVALKNTYKTFEY